MKLNEQNLDKVFREKLERMEVVPPDSVWEGIQNKLLNQKPKKTIIFFRLIAAAAVIVLALIAGWLLNNNLSKQTQPVVENKVAEPVVKPIENLNIPTEKIIPDEEISDNKEKSVIVSASNIKNPENSVPVKNEKLSGSEEIRNFTSDHNKKYKLMSRISGLISESVIIEKLEDWVRNKNFNVSDLTEQEKELITLNSQKISQKPEESNNWEVGFKVSPGYSSQKVGHSEYYANNMTYSNTDGNADVNGGISVGYKVGKRISVESGVYYSQNGQSSGNSSPFLSKNSDAMYASAATEYFNTPVDIKHGQLEMNSTAGVIEFSKTPQNTELSANLDARSDLSNSLLTSSEFSQVFDFIEIPLYMRYKLIDQEFDVEFVGGINANWLVGNNVYMSENNSRENIGKTADISSLNYSGTIGIGVAYNLNKRISVSMEPRFNYYINSINKNVDINYHPYRFGIYTGINYEF